MAARLIVGEYKACRNFRRLFEDGHGFLQNDVNALCEWSLMNMWEELSKDNLFLHKRKVQSFAKNSDPEA